MIKFAKRRLQQGFEPWGLRVAHFKIGIEPKILLVLIISRIWQPTCFLWVFGILYYL